jgi:hypothetical protein
MLPTSLTMPTWQQGLRLMTAAATLKQTCLAASMTSLGPAATQQQQQHSIVLAWQQTVQQQGMQMTISLPVSWVCLMTGMGMGMLTSSRAQAGMPAALQAVQMGCCPTPGASAALAAPAAQQQQLPAPAAPAGMPAAPAGTRAAQLHQQQQQPHSRSRYLLLVTGALLAGCLPGAL